MFFPHNWGWLSTQWQGLYTHYKDFPSQGFDDVRWPFPLPPLLTMLTYYQAKWCGTIRGEITPNYLWLLANPHKKNMIFHHTWKTLHGGNLHILETSQFWMCLFLECHKKLTSLKTGFECLVLIFPILFVAVKLRHQQNVREAQQWRHFWQPRYVQRMGFSALAATWRTWEERSPPTQRNENSHMSTVS